MKIGIIGAMQEEVAQLKMTMSEVKITKKASMDFYEGKLNGKEVVVVQSGIGKVNAAVCTQILIDIFAIDGIINTGIAGSLHNEINIGDIVVSTDAMQHDVDATEFGYPLGQIPRLDVLSFTADKKLAEQAINSCREVNSDIEVFSGRVVSGDQFIADDKIKQKIIENFGGYCTEMEGASIAQAAYLSDIPFVIIRAISDKADDSAKVDYPTFEKQAIKNSVKLVSNMINKL